ncbi:MAG: glycosyltransferase family 9 protein [Candidatus Eremiobacteraeota bacterium]|nr:glycosyltransferase family 9 protein [Candidatus Eremiobacteraeota bacterium]
MGKKPGMTLEMARNILIIRIDRIGDLVLTTPVINELKQICSEGKLTALLSPVNAELISGTGLVDDILVWDDKVSEEKKKVFFKDLRDRQFDAVLAFSPLTTAYRLAMATGAPLRAGIVYSNRILTKIATRFMLTHRFIIDQEKRLAHDHPALHEVEKCAGLLAVLGIPEIEGHLNIPLPEDVINQSRELVDRWTIEGQKGIIGMPLCRRYIDVGWSTKEFKELVEDLRENFPEYLLLITYGNEENVEGETLKESLRDQYGVVVIGDLPLQLWAALMKSLSLLISIDSAAVHLAASGGAPCIVLYPEEIYKLCKDEWAPWGVNHRQLVIRNFQRTSDTIIISAAVLLGKRKEEDE